MRLTILVLCLVLVLTIFSQRKANYSLLFGSTINNSINYGYSSNYIEFGFQPKESIFIPSVGLGSLITDPIYLENSEIPENDFEYISANLEAKWIFKNNVRLKPFIGSKGSFYYLYNPTIQNLKFGKDNMLFAVGPTIGLDFYIAKSLALNLCYPPQLELTTGFQNKFSIGLKYGEKYYSESHSKKANRPDRNNIGVNGVILSGNIDGNRVSGYGVDLLN